VPALWSGQPAVAAVGRCATFLATAKPSSHEDGFFATPST